MNYRPRIRTRSCLGGLALALALLGACAVETGEPEPTVVEQGVETDEAPDDVTLPDDLDLERMRADCDGASSCDASACKGAGSNCGCNGSQCCCYGF